MPRMGRPSWLVLLVVAACCFSVLGSDEGMSDMGFSVDAPLAKHEVREGASAKLGEGVGGYYTLTVKGPKALISPARGVICGAWKKRGFCKTRNYVRRHCATACSRTTQTATLSRPRKVVMKVALSKAQSAPGAGGIQYTLPIGTADPGSRCKFPFTYNGKSYNTCIGKGQAPPFKQSVNFLGQTLPHGWCSTTSKWQGKWGECGGCKPAGWIGKKWEKGRYNYPKCDMFCSYSCKTCYIPDGAVAKGRMCPFAPWKKAGCKSESRRRGVPWHSKAHGGPYLPCDGTSWCYGDPNKGEMWPRRRNHLGGGARMCTSCDVKLHGEQVGFETGVMNRMYPGTDKAYASTKGTKIRPFFERYDTMGCSYWGHYRANTFNFNKQTPPPGYERIRGAPSNPAVKYKNLPGVYNPSGLDEIDWLKDNPSAPAPWMVLTKSDFRPLPVMIVSSTQTRRDIPGYKSAYADGSGEEWHAQCSFTKKIRCETNRKTLKPSGKCMVQKKANCMQVVTYVVGYRRNKKKVGACPNKTGKMTWQKNTNSLEEFNTARRRRRCGSNCPNFASPHKGPKNGWYSLPNRRRCKSKGTNKYPAGTYGKFGGKIRPETDKSCDPRPPLIMAKTEWCVTTVALL